MRPLRCKDGMIRFYQIDARGTISCTADEDVVVPMRIAGKKKTYCQAQLMRCGTLRWYYVHRLMAFSWLGDSPHFLRTIVDHQNGNSLDNTVDNLRWVTQTANNINKKCYGLVEEGAYFIPRISGFNHHRFRTTDRDLALMLRAQLVESYVRYNMRFPLNGSDFPHYSIHKY